MPVKYTLEKQLEKEKRNTNPKTVIEKHKVKKGLFLNQTLSSTDSDDGSDPDYFCSCS